MSPRTLSASALVLSPLKAAGFLLGGIAVVIVITGCQPAEPKKSETEKQASSSTEVSSETRKTGVVTASPTPVPADTVPVPKTAISPKEIYINLYAEINKANTYADVVSVFLQNGSKDMIANVANPVSEAERDKVLKGNKLGAAYCIKKNPIDIQEIIKGSTATAIAPNRNGEDRCELAFVLENNQWKVARSGHDSPL